MSDMVPTGSKYTDEERMNAVVMYAVMGTASSVSRETGISEQTLCGWRKTDWWAEGLEEVRSANADEHIALYQSLTAKALGKAHKGIDELGNDLSASDIKSLVIAGCAGSDKARLLLNQPTSISSKGASYDAIADQFRKLSQQWDKLDSSVVSTQQQPIDE